MKLSDIINKIFLYGFFLLGAILLFFNIARTSLIVASFASAIASLGLGWLLEQKGISRKFMVFFNIALLLNILGEVAFYYDGLPYYDKFLHLSVGFLITIVVFEYFSKNLNIKKDIIFFVVLGLLTLWEIQEYSTLTFFNFQSMGVISNGAVVQSPFDDTMFDLIFGSIGSLIYLLFKQEKSKPNKKSN